MATTASSGMSGKTNRSVSSFISASPGGAPRCWCRRQVEHLEVEFFVEHGDFGLGGAHEQVSGHADEDAVVAGGVVTEQMSQLLGHEASVAGGSQQMLEAGQQFLSGSRPGLEPGTDPRSEWDE